MLREGKLSKNLVCFGKIFLNGAFGHFFEFLKNELSV